MADQTIGHLLGGDQRTIWCGDVDTTGRYVCQQVRDHGGEFHMSPNNNAGGVHYWRVRAAERPENMPAATPAVPDPADCPTGTILVDTATGRWAVRFPARDAREQHVWMAPAGVIREEARILHHSEVRGWEVVDSRRWPQTDDMPPADHDLRTRCIAALSEQVSEFISPNEFGGYDPHYAELVDIVLDVVRPELHRLRARIHEAVDETQRRYAPFQKRCARFDQWSTWARERFEASGDKSWFFSSEAERLLVLSFIQDKEAAEAELADVRASREAWALEADRLDAELASRPTTDAFEKACEALELRRVALVEALGLPTTTSFYDAVDDVADLVRDRAASRPAIPADAGDLSFGQRCEELGHIPAGRYYLTSGVEVGDNREVVSRFDVPGGVRIAGFWPSHKARIEPAPVSGSDTAASGCPACATGREHTFGGIGQFHASSAAVLGEAAEAAKAAGSDATADGGDQ